MAFMSNPADYYISRKPRFLKEFDMVAKSARPVLSRYFGAENINTLVESVEKQVLN